MLICEWILRGSAVGIRTFDELWLRAYSLHSGLCDTRTLRRRHFDGFIATMTQSGTHWLKYMLILTLAKLYDLPPPSSLPDNTIVGRSKSPPLYAQIPQIVIGHSVPHYLLRSHTLFRFLHFPKYLILVRDIRDGLVALYEKQKSVFNVDFSTYLRSDLLRRKSGYDMWTRMRFLNAWGPVVERHPERTAILKYEDLKADTRGELARVCDYFDIKGVSPELLDEVIAGASKERMAKLMKLKKDKSVVRMDPRPSDEWYSDADRRFFAELCRRNLKYTFGYQYW